MIQASSAGHSASGSAGSGIGYGAAGGNPSGILSSVAVEFDSWYNPELNDPSVFHIGVHSNGQNANNASEEYPLPSLPRLFPSLTEKDIGLGTHSEMEHMT